MPKIAMDAIVASRAAARSERERVSQPAAISTTNAPAVLLSHPTGNQNVRNALESLVEQQLLAEFWTAIAIRPQTPWLRLLPASARAQLQRRAFEQAPVAKLKCFPWREAVRLAAPSIPLLGRLCSAERPFSVAGVFRSFDRRVARRLDEFGQGRPAAVYAYEGAALQTYRQARKLGIAALHEQTSAYWHWLRRLFAEEADLNPEFAGLLPTLSDSERHLARKEEELELADEVFVPSHYVRRTLAGAVQEEKIRVIPYGAPPPVPRRVNLDPALPLRVLFVGTLAQHKGIGYLLQAVELAGSKVELTLVGRRICPNPKVDQACRRWRWFDSLPNAGVLDLMLESDVLVLPSLSDAFGLVVTEALAAGLPVIVTPNTGAGELISDGREGFIVPIRDSQAIAERLGRLCDDRGLLAAMSHRAQATAEENSWAGYRALWARAVRAAV